MVERHCASNTGTLQVGLLTTCTAWIALYLVGKKILKSKTNTVSLFLAISAWSCILKANFLPTNQAAWVKDTLLPPIHLEPKPINNWYFVCKLLHRHVTSRINCTQHNPHTIGLSYCCCCSTYVHRSNGVAVTAPIEPRLLQIAFLVLSNKNNYQREI